MLSFHSYQDSPPSLPRTLEDLVHVAYAHDDIHRAKILLLKLKGIEVTSDDDPRIAAVQDEDFDFCFIPNGKLISEEEERAMAEAQRREQKRRLREERLRTCEYIWDHAKRRMRDERLWLQRRREIEERRRAAEEVERQRALKEKEAALQEERAVVRAQTQRRSVVSYDSLPRDSSQPSCEDPFVYDVMVHASSSKHSTPSLSPRRSQATTPSSSPPKQCHSQLQTTRPVLDDRRVISFKDVMSSLHGPLFPLTIEERQRRMSISGSNKSRSQTRDRQRQKQAELLDSLFSVTGWEGAEFRSQKGKAKPRARCSIELPESSVSTSSSYLSSCPSLTRSNSWLSFASGSPGAISPAPSPLIPSWLKRPPSCISCSKPCQQRSQRVPVPLPDSPLHSGPEIPQVELVIGREDEIRLPRAQHQSLVGAANAVVQGFGQFLEVAKQFQRTYMVAAVYSAATLNDGDTFQGEGDYTCWHKKRTVIPDGMRARSMDIKVFLANPTPISLMMEPVQYIPLMSPFPSKYQPRTVLPVPLPYPIVFKPHPPISRSPFRLKQQRGYQVASGAVDRPQLDGHSHGEANLRVRFVGNPAYLRLKALHNVIYERGIDWEGRGKECRISSGKEALPSIAVDGLGRSLLSAG